MSALDWSQTYRGIGWHMLPLLPGDKSPDGALVHDGKDNATLDERITSRWFADPARNIGVACAPSRLLVLDADIPKAKNHNTDGRARLAELEAELGPLPSTPTADTPSGGVHRVFRAPPDDGRGFVGKVGRAIDVIRNGYIVVAPSVSTQYGGTYRWRDGMAPDEIAIVELPAAWVEYLRNPPRSERAPSGEATGESFYDALGALDQRYVLQCVSGSALVGGERFEFKRTTRGKFNLYVDRGDGFEATSNFVDGGGRIGARNSGGKEDGGPLASTWLRWYGRDDKEIRRQLVDLVPELAAWERERIRKRDEDRERGRSTEGPRVDGPRTQHDDNAHESSAPESTGADDSSTKSPTSEKRAEWEWAPPLEQFLGDEEPNDDDAEDWIVRDLIPRAEPFIFGGEWKSGKTWTAIGVAVAVALGRPFLKFENTLGRPGRVLLIALEDSRRRLRKRVWQVLRGLDMTPNDETIRTHLRIWDKAIRLPGDAKEVTRFVAEMKRWQPDVIMIDSLSRAMTGSQNDIKDATAFTAVWRDMTIATGASIGFLHHTNKPNADSGKGKTDTFAKMRGSGELLAAPRNLIVMERLGTEETKLSAVSMRGNLDLRRTSFALEYTQEERSDGRIAVMFQDRGDVEAVLRAAVDAKKAERKTAAERKEDQITRAALQVARDRGAVSAATLAVILSVGSRTAARYLADRRDQKLLGTPTDEGAPITKQGLAWLAEHDA